MIDVTDLELGQDIAEWQSINQSAFADDSWDLSGFFTDWFDEQGYFEDSWVDNENYTSDDWWNFYGGHLDDLGGTWDPEDLDLITDFRAEKLSDFRSDFSVSDHDIGVTGFAQASNIGESSDLGGEANWRGVYEEGISPIEKDFERSRDNLWTQYGQSYLDMIQSLMLSDAWGSDVPGE